AESMEGLEYARRNDYSWQTMRPAYSTLCAKVNPCIRLCRMPRVAGTAAGTLRRRPYRPLYGLGGGRTRRRGAGRGHGGPVRLSHAGGGQELRQRLLKRLRREEGGAPRRIDRGRRDPEAV